MRRMTPALFARPAAPMPPAAAWRRALGMAALMAIVIPMAYILSGIVALGGGTLEMFLEIGGWVPLTFLTHGTILAALLAGHRWVPGAGRARLPGLAALVLAEAGIGVTVTMVAHRLLPAVLPDAAVQPGYMVQLQLMYALLYTLVYDYMQRTKAATDARHAAELQRVALERELAAAQLQLLQAQIEPHFLFNTLANLRRLVRTDRVAARAMLADLMGYLEMALPRLRDERGTLDREMALLQSYLAVHQVRMGARLRTEFDVPAALGGRELPPMLLLTLVENAIKHGVQPRVEGATIRVEARAGAAGLELVVSDTGGGMTSGSGGGTGLANLRARLRALYGDAASLRLGVNEPHGLVATIVIPEVAA